MSAPERIADADLARVRERHPSIEQDEIPEPLFEGFDEPVVPVGETAGERRRARQALAIASGFHPLHVTIPGILLHPDAPTDVAAGTRAEPVTCGSCVHRVHYGRYAKCDVPPRNTHSEATDVKSSWPACTDYEEKP